MNTKLKILKIIILSNRLINKIILLIILIISLLYLSVVIKFYNQFAIECKSVDILQNARQLIKEETIKISKMASGSIITDIEERISNVTILGPQMEFDNPDQRYIQFNLDTGCGQKSPMSIMVSKCGHVQSMTPYQIYCQAKRASTRVSIVPADNP